MPKALFSSQVFTPLGGFTSGIEGPAVDAEGNLYVVNYARQGTIGKVTPDGKCSIFLDLPDGSIGNGIRFDSAGNMLIADYAGHNIFRVDTRTRKLTIFTHEPKMNQPNDIAIGADDTLYASDPNWADETGQLWRIDRDGSVTLLEAKMGTTNGIEIGAGETTLYVNESIQRCIWAYDLFNGEISNKRLLIEFLDFGLDGMRCDVAGNLYVTRYGKGTVAKISPKGQVLREIRLSGERPSNLAFGGPDGCLVYVTLADQGNIEGFRVDQPGRQWQFYQRRRQRI
jgi:gluconolactonase